MTNHRQRASRARSRAATHDDNVGLSLTETVRCAHGLDFRHKVTVQVSHSGDIVHISSDCTRNPPSEQEVAVNRGLLGDQEYGSCTDVVTEIRARVALAYQREQETRIYRAKNFPVESVGLPQYTLSVVRAAAERARSIGEKRACNPPLGAKELATVQRLESRKKMAKSLLASIVYPARWKVDLVLQTIEHREHLAVAIGLEWATYYRVAWYTGQGRFRLDQNGIDSLKRAVHESASYNSDGKKACTVCGVAINSLSQHTKSKRHQANVEKAVYDLCTALGARLKRRPQGHR